MSHDLNKICVSFPSPILDMIIVCYIFFDNSLFASLSCYYDVNPVVALSGPNGVVPSNDRHISRGLLLCIFR